MTKEEAIKDIQDNILPVVGGKSLVMAIYALRQPEIIRCKDCRNNHWCNIQEAAMAGDNFFCGAAERRTDEGFD